MHSYNLLHHHHPCVVVLTRRSNCGWFYLGSNNSVKFSTSLKLRGSFSTSLKIRGSSSGSWCENEMSLYSVLGVGETVSCKEVKQAYKKMARKYHPDVSPGDRVEENTKRFIKLKEAYETLSDPITRAVYDTNFAISLNFASSSHYHHHQVSEQKKEWKKGWESQLSKLKRRSECRDRSEENMPWAARMGQNMDVLLDNYYDH
ncbi:hypothetical protein TanjilG_33030 [Lupinus angustifolius]|uniref:J domain-containing protein n=1 Tax=Lupinus angustifolius TaxID=3871 RepID=A0A4P1RNH1_LUPAN|nr:PREDICTED: chaperone protein dnaJ 20, chloroplastic-like [Lupinus angustifolius]OIW14688.1 hypothetical protein TanjilG_33030 [Lupinus angustifolius]